MHRVVLIPGDGIGPEVTRAAREVVDASGAPVSWQVAVAGLQAQRDRGTPLPEDVVRAVAEAGTALKGPTATPFGGDYRIAFERRAADGSIERRSYPSITVALRNELGLFVNLRPVKLYPGIEARFGSVDLLIFRENTEDLYLGIERMRDPDTAEATKVITRGASRRVAAFALDTMRRLGRKRLTVVHKANILKLTDGLFLDSALAVAAGYPDVVTEHKVVDALCADLVSRPEAYDGLLLPNLYGDIVSDLAAGLAGGLGIAPGANFGPACAEFEAVHGTAPDIAGKDAANPTAMILSAMLMLRHLGEHRAAAAIEVALSRVLAQKRFVTRDLGGSCGTRRMTEAILEALAAG
ncbi:MAG TPA: isocitrate/isopropylmalate family dehydrogenase [Burkholderiales bacterium]|nr:isocitrate/isopropylmalate family dehydrogenase [Burkholderiales bacterium]